MKIHYTADGMADVAQGARGGLPAVPSGRSAASPTEASTPSPPAPASSFPPARPLSRSPPVAAATPPWQRDLDRVAQDVREGWVSRARAREVYRVEVDERGRW
jgi:N-methylhydantoinase B